MSWLQLCISSDRDQVAALEDAVLAAGAVSVTLQDNANNPILEPGVGQTPLWQQVRLLALFEADIDTSLAMVLIVAELGFSPPNWQWDIVEDQVWERAWMDSFQPLRCGERLWICPSWQDPPDTSAVNLLLDPGLAFGTGTHPTTALCLQWLDREALTGQTVLDYGCGSGILAIAALLLGAESAIAVDNDPQALIATRDNAERNGIDPARLQTLLPEQLPASARFDTIVANILASALTELAPLLASHAHPTTRIALSGILAHQADALRSHYRPWFALDEIARQDDWCRLGGLRQTP